MIPVKESFEFICQTLDITPEKLRSLGNKKHESYTKRIIQVLLKDFYEKNAPYEDIGKMMGLNVATVFEGVTTARLWIKVDYEDFTTRFRPAEKQFHSWIRQKYIDS